MNMRRLSLILVMLFSVGVLSACNTLEGVGKDVEAAGGALKDTADENNTYK